MLIIVENERPWTFEATMVIIPRNLEIMMVLFTVPAHHLPAFSINRRAHTHTHTHARVRSIERVSRLFCRRHVFLMHFNTNNDPFCVLVFNPDRAVMRAPDEASIP